MPSGLSVPQLARTKTALGAIEFLDFRALDLITAHQELGKDVRFQTQRILSKKLDQLDRGQLVAQIRLVRRCKSELKHKILAPNIDYRIQDTLKKYLACLSAWSKGVQLDEFHHRSLQDLSVEGEAISSEDLALLLQNDNTGCQTGIYREQDGSIILWHTEEDEEEPRGRFDKLRIATFQKSENHKTTEVNAFIYPEILPGPAYCWHNDGFAQAVDSLYLKPNDRDGHIFANIATWATFFLGKEIQQEKVINELSPFVDGYALTAIQEIKGVVSAKILEFAGDQLVVSLLGDNAHEYLFQVNLVSRKGNSISKVYEEIDLESRRYYEERIVRTNRIMRSIKSPANSLPWFFRLLASRLGGDSAYANEYVKSYIINRVSSTGMELWIGAGPALLTDSPIVIVLKGYLNAQKDVRRAEGTQ